MPARVMAALRDDEPAGGGGAARSRTAARRRPHGGRSEVAQGTLAHPPRRLDLWACREREHLKVDDLLRRTHTHYEETAALRASQRRDWQRAPAARWCGEFVGCCVGARRGGSGPRRCSMRACGGGASLQGRARAAAAAEQCGDVGDAPASVGRPSQPGPTCGAAAGRPVLGQRCDHRREFNWFGGRRWSLSRLRAIGRNAQPPRLSGALAAPALRHHGRAQARDTAIRHGARRGARARSAKLLETARGLRIRKYKRSFCAHDRMRAAPSTTSDFGTFRPFLRRQLRVNIHVRARYFFVQFSRLASRSLRDTRTARAQLTAPRAMAEHLERGRASLRCSSEQSRVPAHEANRQLKARALGMHPNMHGRSTWIGNTGSFATKLSRAAGSHRGRAGSTATRRAPTAAGEANAKRRSGVEHAAGRLDEHGEQRGERLVELRLTLTAAPAAPQRAPSAAQPGGGALLRRGRAAGRGTRSLRSGRGSRRRHPQRAAGRGPARRHTGGTWGARARGGVPGRSAIKVSGRSGATVFDAWRSERTRVGVDWGERGVPGGASEGQGRGRERAGRRGARSAQGRATALGLLFEPPALRGLAPA